MSEEESPTNPEVQYFGAENNPMFPQWLTEMVTFARYKTPVPCAHCGKISREHWTLCVPFTVSGIVPGVFHLVEGAKVHRPGSPVCEDHMPRPAFRTPTEDGPTEDAEVVIAALSEPERGLSIRGPAGNAFHIDGRWATVDNITADPAERGNIVHHASASHALDCISATIPERKRRTEEAG